MKKKIIAKTEKHTEISENLKSTVLPFKQNKTTVKTSGITIKIFAVSRKSVAFMNFRNSKNVSAAAQKEIKADKINSGLEIEMAKISKYKILAIKKDIKNPKKVNLSAVFTGKPITALPKIKRVLSAIK